MFEYILKPFLKCFSDKEMADVSHLEEPWGFLKKRNFQPTLIKFLMIIIISIFI